MMSNDLKDRLKSANLSFKGAARKHPIPEADWGKVSNAAREWAKDTGMPVNQAITVACGMYFELLDERKKK